MLGDVGMQRTVEKDGLLLEVELLRQAHLGQQVKVVVQSGEIRLLPVEEEEDWHKILDDLAGCLGTERVTDYDFDLKIRNPYAA